MKQKYNDESENIREWSTEKIKNEVCVYDDLIYGRNPCFSVRDVKILNILVDELEKRGVKIKIAFDD